MSSHEPGRPQRETIEEILDEVPGSTTAETDALLALFSAAPPASGPLPGEDAAVAAFLAAHPAPVPTRRGKRVGALAALLSVKTAAAAVALTALGGVALAATTEVLPEPLTIDSHKSEPKKVEPVPSRDVPDQDPTNAAAVADAAKAAAAADRAAARAGKDKSASYSGLCTAFTARGGDAAAAPAFARLVAAAPDGDVATFCSALAEEPTVKNPAKGKPADAREKAAEKREAAEQKRDAAADEKATGDRVTGKPDKEAPKDRGNAPATNPAAENAGQGRADRS